MYDLGATNDTVIINLFIYDHPQTILAHPGLRYKKLESFMLERVLTIC